MEQRGPLPEIPLQTMDERAQRNLGEAQQSAPAGSGRVRCGAGFFTLGLLNNLPYVVILTAALELLPSDVPTGVLAFVNIAPALVAKAVFPYFLKGEIRYAQRVLCCVSGAFGGMLVTALFQSLFIRLLGVGTASFMSGLGEITYLQYTTRYPAVVTKYCVGWFASGTGAAGLVGALAWWIVRPLGVRLGLGILSLLPFGMAVAFFSLPKTAAQDAVVDTRDEAAQSLMRTNTHEEEEVELTPLTTPTSLSFTHKMELLRPMLLPYILPLVSVYFAEYTINQGIVRLIRSHTGPYPFVHRAGVAEALAAVAADPYVARLLPIIPTHLPGRPRYDSRRRLSFSLAPIRRSCDFRQFPRHGYGCLPLCNSHSCFC